MVTSTMASTHKFPLGQLITKQHKITSAKRFYVEKRGYTRKLEWERHKQFILDKLISKKTQQGVIDALREEKGVLIKYITLLQPAATRARQILQFISKLKLKSVEKPSLRR